MKGFDSSGVIILYVISNILAIILLVTAWKLPRVSRFFYFLLFLWAGWVNRTTALKSPELYLGEADLTFIPFYKDFINGWFSTHITGFVGAIATCQVLIAVSMLLKGGMFRTGAIGAAIFLLAIAPFGVGSAFPSTVIAAVGMYMLAKRHDIDLLWHKPDILSHHFDD